MKRNILLLATAFSFLGSANPYAADKLSQVEAELVQKKQQQSALAAAALEASKNLEDLRSRMIASTKTLQEKEAEQETLEDRLDDLTRAIAAKSKTAAEQRKQLTMMLAALVEIGSRPPESLFLQNRVMADHIHRSLLLEALLPRLKDKAANAAFDVLQLYDLQTRLGEQKRLVDAAHANLEKQQAALDQMIATRQGFLQRTEAQKEETIKRLATLAVEARDLRQLMEKVTIRPNVKRPSGKSSVSLHWPVVGVVRKNFGDKDADDVRSEGLTLAAPSGAPIVAPFAGKVVFLGPFRGYGQIMILQHANGYHSFLSGFGRIDAEMGQEVVAGEPLGVLPLKAGGKPELYFEWRQGDDPVDPMGGLEKKSASNS